MKLEEVIGQIKPLDQSAMKMARVRWDSIVKPLSSLGMMEDIVTQIAGISGDSSVDIQRKVLVEMCADNGVVEEGISQSGQEVTALVAENFLAGQSVACLMCRENHADVVPIDIGMAVDTKVTTKYKVTRGTKNFTREPAMTRQQAVRGIEMGIQAAQDLVQMGYSLIATGEMGIGNTTTSSAVASVLLGEPVEEMTGKGAGLSNQGLVKKIQAIQRGIVLHNPDPKDPIDVLAKVGGLDIAGMVGLYLGGAWMRTPVLMDGFISCVAALIAVRLCPNVDGYLVPSHMSKEPASQKIMAAIGKEPMLHANMCMGEGTGAAAVFPLLDLAVKIYTTMSTFEDVNLEQYEHFD